VYLDRKLREGFSPGVHIMAGYSLIGLLGISILLGTWEFQKQAGKVGCPLLTRSHGPSWEVLSEV
jgi:hypothetical protein